MKDKIIELLKSTERPGIDKLIEHMNEIGFFTAPCSERFHLCKEGGLAEHSLNVWNVARPLSIEVSLSNTIPESSLILATLLHDIGKSGYRGKQNYIPNMIQDRKNKGEYILSTAKPFVTNRSLLISDHAYKSCMIASKFIELTEEEEFAIRYHDGMYVPSGREIQGKERPLQLLLHFADMWCSRFIETDGGEDVE